jgi:hypothetical protein
VTDWSLNKCFSFVYMPVPASFSLFITTGNSLKSLGNVAWLLHVSHCEKSSFDYRQSSSNKTVLLSTKLTNCHCIIFINLLTYFSCLQLATFLCLYHKCLMLPFFYLGEIMQKVFCPLNSHHHSSRIL